jgi:hypothetical protein
MSANAEPARVDLCVDGCRRPQPQDARTVHGKRCLARVDARGFDGDPGYAAPEVQRCAAESKPRAQQQIGVEVHVWATCVGIEPQRNVLLVRVAVACEPRAREVKRAKGQALGVALQRDKWCLERARDRDL